ncbi:MAG: dihydrodipicolinate synthase family protein [Thermomicrobiales bacterium]|nr:MAG: dihydrodipicolinate synthase family protein [Thermomicrobiales bacterium]
MTALVHGILPPMVTPFGDDESIDEAGLRSEARFMLDAGVHGLCVGGSTGEGHTLSIEETCRITEIALEEANGRVPVISGIIRDSTREVVAYGKALKTAGADALQITPVHYLFSSGDDGTYAYYERIANEVGLPIVIYNVVPWNTVSPEALMRLSEIDQVVAVKQSGGDIHKLADLLLMNDGRLIIYSAVDDLLYPSFALGADGAIAAILTVMPVESVALWEAVKRGDHAEARSLHGRLLPVWRAMNHPDMSARTKAILALQGRTAGMARHPILPVSDDVRAFLAATLERSGVDVRVAM